MPIEFNDLKRGLQISRVSNTNLENLKKIRDIELDDNIKDIEEENLISFKTINHILKNDQLAKVNNEIVIAGTFTDIKVFSQWVKGYFRRNKTLFISYVLCLGTLVTLAITGKLDLIITCIGLLGLKGVAFVVLLNRYGKHFKQSLVGSHEFYNLKLNIEVNKLDRSLIENYNNIIDNVNKKINNINEINNEAGELIFKEITKLIDNLRLENKRLEDNLVMGVGSRLKELQQPNYKKQF